MNATMAATAEGAIEVLGNNAVDIVLTDLMLPHTSGLELLKRVHDTHPNLPVIVLTQYGTIDSAVAATRMGAIDYVTKPFRIEELRARLERASRDCCASNCARGRGSAGSSVYPRECSECTKQFRR
jgi:DNA-binding NtrC family response regulator